MDQPYRIGIIGYSGTKFDTAKAHTILEEAISLRALSHPQAEVVSGYTDLGIPAIAYRIANRLGLPTVGIACKKAHEYPRYPCNKVIIEGETWGDESEVFLEYIDELLRVGGGKQSIAEYDKFQGPKTYWELSSQE